MFTYLVPLLNVAHTMYHRFDAGVFMQYLTCEKNYKILNSLLNPTFMTQPLAAQRPSEVLLFSAVMAWKSRLPREVTK